MARGSEGAGLRRVAEALLGSEQRFQALLDSVGAGLLLSGPDAVVRMCNHAGLDLLGLRKDELIGASLFDPKWEAVYEDGSKCPAKEHPIPRAIATQQPVRDAVLGVLRPAKRDVVWLLVTAEPRFAADGAVSEVVCTLVDISERKRLEDQLRQSRMLEAVGRLAGGVAHDFNNLLTVILAYSEAAREPLAPEDPLAKSIGEIEKAARRAGLLTRQLLAFNRRQRPQPAVLDLNAIISGVERMLPRMIGENIKLRTVLHPRLGRVKADAGQVQQVIVNLAVNARAAMPDGGELTIETANVQLGEADAAPHPGVIPGRYVMAAFSDTGAGMDEDTQARAFEPSFTTKDTGEGTGLDLSMGIVKQSGGHIWCSGEPGKGATFKLFLPRLDEAGAVNPDPAGPVEVFRGSETILLVEDEEAVRRLIRTVLAGAGYTVLEARNGAEALSLSTAHEGPIHLLVTDVVMPGMSGPTLADQIAGLRSQIRVLYISGYTDNEILRQGVLEAGKAFLAKPFSVAAVSRKVREVLDSKLPGPA